ncbi:cyclodeaminase/cyclohydrolase family protein [Arcticibacter sp. MXS-1]|uniref:cyclodeaminase/cyclohydrolase family protein n=1 Tax=Arcticibacter sp. MXS-1 TaxID=3341726 RepID=UPI0035A98578
MQKDTHSLNTRHLTVDDILRAVSGQKPSLTGGNVTLTCATLALSVISMALELSIRGTRDKAIKSFLVDKLSYMRQISQSFLLAGEQDQLLFDELREFKGKKQRSFTNPFYYHSYLKTVTSPLEAAGIFVKAATAVSDVIPYCKKGFMSDIGAGCYLLSSSFHALMLIAESNIKGMPKDKSGQYDAQKQEIHSQAEQLFLKINAEVHGRMTAPRRKHPFPPPATASA